MLPACTFFDCPVKMLPLFFLLFFKTAFSQVEYPDTLISRDLAPVQVTAYRIEQPDLATPLAISVVSEYRLQHGQQQLALDEALAAVPGVFVQNGDNFAQDLRVSIRGFGARSAFGIRGIKILVDGFPETTPDGQGQVDNIDPGTVTSLNVIRGPTSGLYGNASGGVIQFNTLNFREKEFFEAGFSAGSYGFQKYQFKTGGGKTGRFLYQLGGNYTRTDGYRELSGMENFLLNGGILLPLDSTSQLRLVFNYVNSPEAGDPGGISREQATENPRSAWSRNLQFDAGEALEQGRVGVSWEKRFQKNHQLTARAYHTRRTFSNKLPFQAGGLVEFDRAFSGGGVAWQFSGKLLGLPWLVSAGTDFDYQSDDRRRFDNLDGKKGELGFNQQEIFSNLGVYLVQAFQLTSRFSIHPGLRFDLIHLEAKDRFLTDGNDSGQRDYQRLNPILGAVYAFSPGLNFYANLATSFETPALTELSANPSGGGGFNPELKPQHALSYELGVKGWLKKQRLRYDVALFYLDLKDEFLPYELTAFPGRTFYRNVGTSRRKGIETGLGTYLGKGFYTYLNYAFSDFKILDDQAVIPQKRQTAMPGIPRHRGYLELRYFKAQGIFATVQTQFNGSFFADNANEVETGSFVLANIRLGYRKRFEKWWIEPFAGTNNLFGTNYFSNVRVNAAGGRYFEPAPERNFFAGVKIGAGK